MQHFIRLGDLKKEDIFRIFEIADGLQQGKYKDYLKGKTFVMFFPASSIRTRVTFEKGVYLLGGQTILFEPSTLDKKEELKDVIGYLNNWADGVIVRHKDIGLIEKLSACAKMPIINAMTDCNHPCEMMADMYSLWKLRKDFTKDNFLFVGAAGNIGYAWKEAARLMGFSLEQSCPKGYELEGVEVRYDLTEVLIGKDVICTDSLSGDKLVAFKNHQVTLAGMKTANAGAILNPCPPFFRGEEVSAEVIDSPYFVGYEFKKYLLEIQQAIIIFCMEGE